MKQNTTSETTKASNGSLPLQFNVVKHSSVDVVGECNMIAALNKECGRR